MKNKKIFFFFIIIIIIVCLIFILKNVFKKSLNGNNMSSQEIVDYILNINSYVANVNVKINSNKNSNMYVFKQEYNTENGNVLEVIEPANISGLKIVRKDNILDIENTQLDLKTVFENYEEFKSNSLNLYNFIEDYKYSENASWHEENDEIIMEVKKSDNRYMKYKVLYINKENAMPKKMIVKDDNQNMTIFIEYNEIELN